jgi:hypothetical protein
MILLTHSSLHVCYGSVAAAGIMVNTADLRPHPKGRRASETGPRPGPGARVVTAGARCSATSSARIASRSRWLRGPRGTGSGGAGVRATDTRERAAARDTRRLARFETRRKQEARCIASCSRMACASQVIAAQPCIVRAVRLRLAIRGD